MEAGDRIADRFTLISLAGKGGMGEVWRAQDAHLGADVAVKVLRFEGSAADRFQRECQVLATLQHPNIVAYVSHGVTEAGQLFLAMEWLDGEDLGDRLGRGTVSIEESLALTARVAAALAEAHRRGIVHRDLKPENIFLVGRSPRDIRVLDFGIARVLEGTRAITKTGALIGTPGYMSPEQARGETSLGPPSDIFSLGCVLFECITGHQAFAGDQLVAILAKLLLAEPPRLSAYRTDVPPELDSLLVRMLEKEPDARPPDAAALLEDLEGVRTDIKSPSGLPIPIRSFAPSERRIVSIILAGSPDPVSAETLVSGEDQRRSQVIRKAASSPDLRLESLADGTSVLVLEGGGEAKDRAERAASVALAVRRSAPDLPMSLATGWTRAGGGLPVGEVIDRAVHQLAVIGDGSEWNGVVVDQPTAQLLRDRFDVVDRDGSHLLIRETDLAAGTTPRSHSPFVGRESVVERLLFVIREACDERFPRAIIVSGDPGVGKSRVREEVLRRLSEQDKPPAIWFSRGDALARGAPLHVLRQMLGRELLPDEGVDEASSGLDSLHDSLTDIVAPDRLVVVERYLSEVLGLAEEDDGELANARAKPEVLRARIREAFGEFIASVTSETPVVFVIEDMQNGDLASLKVFEGVIRDRRDIPVIFMAFGRPEVRELLPLLETDWDLTVIRLQGIRPPAAAEFARQVLGPDTSDDVIERIVRLGEGNPLQLEEILRATLVQRESGPERESGSEEFRLPESLATILSSRLDRLDPKLRTVVRVASIFGEGFSTEGVRALLGTYDRKAIDVLLAELVRAEIISPVSGPADVADPRFRFRQGLVRDAAYASLSRDDRAIGHGLAASIEEARRNPEPDVLAYHLIAAGRRDDGARKLFEAARDAWVADDAMGACLRTERAISIAESPILIGELHLLASRAQEKLAHLDAADEHATAALEALPEAHALHFEALAHRAAVRSLAGNPLAPQDAARLVGASNEELGGPIVAASISSAAFNLLNTLDRYGGKALAERMERAYGENDEPWAIAALSVVRGRCAVVEGDYGAQVRHAAAAHASLSELAEPGRAAWQLVAQGFGHAGVGRYRRAIAFCERGRVEAIAARDDYVRRHAELTLAHSTVYLGEAAAALPLIEHGLAEALSGGDEFTTRMAKNYRAHALWRLGRIDDALECARDNFMGGENVDIIAEVGAGALIAAMLVEEERYEEAVEVAAPLVRAKGDKLKLGEGLLRFTLYRALSATGQEDAARAALVEAHRELLNRAARITDDDFRRSFVEDIAAHAATMQAARAHGLTDEIA
ncbi:MAG: hypothetical protein DRJ42_16925 [Deltaproteobacteria bacterium]|nr:MAG: hypothetical protein DRJ42_16925 [Deltaproteobacteria bacterium]